MSDMVSSLTALGESVTITYEAPVAATENLDATTAAPVDPEPSVAPPKPTPVWVIPVAVVGALLVVGIIVVVVVIVVKK